LLLAEKRSKGERENWIDMPTINQKKVVRLTLEKLGNNEIINKGDILEEVGYSETTTKNPQTIYESDGVKELLDPILNKMKKKRDMAINAITQDKIDASKAKELTDIVDTFTKNIQLLSGGDTERQKVVFLPSEIINKHNLNGTNTGSNTDSK